MWTSSYPIPEFEPVTRMTLLADMKIDKFWKTWGRDQWGFQGGIE
jgi:hypothetical protein